MDELSREEVSELKSKAEQFDKMQRLSALNQQEREELEQQLAHVINGSNVLHERDKAAYHKLQLQLSAYSDSLQAALRDKEEMQGKHVVTCRYKSSQQSQLPPTLHPPTLPVPPLHPRMPSLSSLNPKP